MRQTLFLTTFNIQTVFNVKPVHNSGRLKRWLFLISFMLASIFGFGQMISYVNSEGNLMVDEE